MLDRVNWLARVGGFAWVGVLAFAIFPPTSAYGVPARAAGYGLLGLGMLGWALLDLRPGLARWQPRLLGPTFAVMAVGSGFGAGVGSGGMAMIAFSFVAIMVAGSDLELPAALAVTGAGMLALEISAALSGGDYLTFVALPIIMVSGLIIGRNRAAYRVQAEQTAALLREREALAGERRRADLLDERARIAREIHDVLAHSLGALGIQIQAARAVLTDSADVAKATELLTAAQRMAADGLVETRRAIYALRTDAPPLPEQIAGACQTYARRYQVDAELDTVGTPVPLSPDGALALLRITQEALVNAAKHAAGQRVSVLLDYSGPRLRLTLRNRLAGGAAELATADAGYGLTGMRERLRLLGGSLAAGRHGGEWIVTAELPRPDTMTA